MEAWQKRVIQEREELMERLKKLIMFDASDLDEETQTLMHLQKSVMGAYTHILDMRIAKFDK